MNAAVWLARTLARETTPELGRALGITGLGLIILLVATLSAVQGVQELAVHAQDPEVVSVFLVSQWLQEKGGLGAPLFVGLGERNRPLYRLATYTGLPLGRFTTYATQLGPSEDVLVKQVSTGRTVYVIDFGGEASGWAASSPAIQNGSLQVSVHRVRNGNIEVPIWTISP